MTLLERAAHLVPWSTIEWISAVNHEIDQRGARIERDFNLLAEEQTRRLDPDARARLVSRETPPFGIYGVGLFRSDRGGFQPAVFVMPELIGLEPTLELVVTGSNDSPIAALLDPLGHAPPPDTLVVAIPPPREAYARVACVGAPAGTVGMPVWLANGAAGFLTAGHVAPSVGAVAQINGVDAGVVRHSNHRRLHRHPEATADVAAIELHEPGSTKLDIPQLSGMGDAVELERVRVCNISGDGTEEIVRAIQPRFAVDEYGAWADVIFVDAAISVPGDSGAMVVDPNDRVVEQVVAGHPPAYSLVQDVDLLLSDSATLLRT